MEPTINYLMELFPDRVAVEPYTGQTQHGTESYGSGTSYLAYVTGRVQTIIGEDGKEQVSRVHAIFAGAPGVSSKDRFTLPERFSTNPSDASDLRARQPKAIAVRHSTDENGAHHETVFF